MSHALSDNHKPEGQATINRSQMRTKVGNFTNAGDDLNQMINNNSYNLQLQNSGAFNMSGQIPIQSRQRPHSSFKASSIPNSTGPNLGK